MPKFINTEVRFDLDLEKIEAKVDEELEKFGSDSE